MRIRTAVAAIGALLLSIPVQAGTLATYSFDGLPGTQDSTPVDANPAGLTFTDIVRGPGLTPEDGDDSMNSRGWTGYLTPDFDDFYGFSVNVDAGTTYDLDFVEFTARRSDTGPLGLILVYSFDGFATSGVAALLALSDITEDFRLSLGLSDVFNNLTTGVGFRIFAYGATSSRGTFRLGIDNSEPNSDLPNNLLVGGVIHSTAVPEPSSVALVGIGIAMVGGAAWRRRPSVA